MTRHAGGLFVFFFGRGGRGGGGGRRPQAVSSPRRGGRQEGWRRQAAAVGEAAHEAASAGLSASEDDGIEKGKSFSPWFPRFFSAKLLVEISNNPNSAAAPRSLSAFFLTIKPFAGRFPPRALLLLHGPRRPPLRHLLRGQDRLLPGRPEVPPGRHRTGHTRGGGKKAGEGVPEGHRGVQVGLTQKKS